MSDKLASIEDLMNTKLFECNKKMNELYSLQHKNNEVNKINAQSSNNQFKYYAEEPYDNDDHLINSDENSCSPKVNMNNIYFVGKNKNNYEPFMSDNENKVELLSDKEQIVKSIVNNSENIIELDINDVDKQIIFEMLNKENNEKIVDNENNENNENNANKINTIDE